MRILHCTWAVLALLSGLALAQTPAAAEADTGYTLFVRGIPVGREDVSVRRASDGTTVTSHGTAAAPLNSVWRHIEYEYAADGTPRRFELDGSLGGVDVVLRTIFENG